MMRTLVVNAPNAGLLLGYAIGMAAMSSPTPANASCGSRPGTPNEVQIVAKSPYSVEVSWRNTNNKGMNPSGSASTDPKVNMWFDMYLEYGDGRSTGKNLTGAGPYSVNYGSRSSKTFDGLTKNTNYCFSLKARSRSGSEGCLSERASNRACATTLAEAAQPAPPAPVAAKKCIGRGCPAIPGEIKMPRLYVKSSPGNAFLFMGQEFAPNSLVVIKAADDAASPNAYIRTDSAGQAIRSNDRGFFMLDQPVRGLCQRPGRVLFTANDGRTSSADRTGMLWTKAAAGTCS